MPLLLTESGIALFESDAIIEFIDDEYGVLEQNVTNEQRALDRAWSYLASKNYLVQCATMSSKDKGTFEQGLTRFISAFKKVESQLSSNNHFFKSDQISNVDIAWLPLLHRAAIIEEHTGLDFFCQLAKVKAWQQEVLKLPLINKTVAADFEEKFANFYLTNTYLSETNNSSIVGIQQVSACNTISCCG